MRTKGEVVFAGAIVALGIFTLIDASRIVIPIGSSNAVGPRGFPYLIGAALVVTGIVVVVRTVRRNNGSDRAEPEAKPEAEPEQPEQHFELGTLAKLIGFVLVHLLTFELLGWPLASALLFGGVAWSLGAKSLVRATLIGLLLGIVTYAGFAYGLGISIPALPFWPSANEVLSG